MALANILTRHRTKTPWWRLSPFVPRLAILPPALLWIVATSFGPGAAHGQIVPTVSPPVFAAPLTPTAFPGSVPLVPAIGTSLTKVENIQNANEVQPADLPLNGVTDAPPDLNTLVSPSSATTMNRSRRIAALPEVEAVSRRLTGGLDTSPILRPPTVGAIPQSALAFGSTFSGSDGRADGGVEPPRMALSAQRTMGLSPSTRPVRTESASYSKLDALSPEVLASRPVGLNTASANGGYLNTFVSRPSVVPTQPSLGASFAFHPSPLSGVAVSRRKPQAELSASQKSLAKGIHKGVLPRARGEGALPGDAIHVPKIPQIGVPNPLAVARKP